MSLLEYSVGMKESISTTKMSILGVLDSILASGNQFVSRYIDHWDLIVDFGHLGSIMVYSSLLYSLCLVLISMNVGFTPQRKSMEISATSTIVVFPKIQHRNRQKSIEVAAFSY